MYLQITFRQFQCVMKLTKLNLAAISDKLPVLCKLPTVLFRDDGIFFCHILLSSDLIAA